MWLVEEPERYEMHVSPPEEIADTWRGYEWQKAWEFIPSEDNVYNKAQAIHKLNLVDDKDVLQYGLEMWSWICDERRRGTDYSLNSMKLDYVATHPCREAKIVASCNSCALCCVFCFDCRKCPLRSCMGPDTMFVQAMIGKDGAAELIRDVHKQLIDGTYKDKGYGVYTRRR